MPVLWTETSFKGTLNLEPRCVVCTVPCTMTLLHRGSLEFFKGGCRASESNEYIGGLGKRKVTAREASAEDQERGTMIWLKR